MKPDRILEHLAAAVAEPARHGPSDRPSSTERVVQGSVREGSTASHARGLDLDRRGARVRALAGERPLSVAVVGAGLSGLTCARILVGYGHRVRVLDKGRGPGGRISTRRAGTRRFDHGAQYFTVRDRRFARWVDSWKRDGLVAPWTGTLVSIENGSRLPVKRSTERLVGVPGMSAIARHLAADLDVAGETRVDRIEKAGARLGLHAPDGSELGRFDAVVVTAPAPQAAALLVPVSPALATRAGEAELAPCWAAMAAFSRPLDVGFDGAFIEDSPLRWAARNASKPGRPEEECWVLHAGPGWSRDHLELEDDDAAERLLSAFRDILGGLAVEPAHVAAHRWRFALPENPLSTDCLFDPELRIAACGDWCGGPRMEGAFLSGRAAAEKIRSLRPDHR